jgi:crossover junction endodeoxyribonuclease RuvC
LIVLGIDPSSTSTGFGLLDCQRGRVQYLECGCLRPPAGLAFEDRLVFLHERLSRILTASPPDEVAMETTFYGKDAAAAAKLGQARGVLLLAARQAGHPVSHYSPAEVKKSVVGRGQATKQQVQYMVARLLGLRELPRPLDASDALAIAYCHGLRMSLRLGDSGRTRKPEIEALLRRVRRR